MYSYELTLIVVAFGVFALIKRNYHFNISPRGVVVQQRELSSVQELATMEYMEAVSSDAEPRTQRM